MSLTATGNLAAGATYSWSLGNRRTATGAGPFNVIYTSGGSYTITLITTYASGCQTTSTATVFIGQSIVSCCPANIPASNLLGTVGTSTTLSGGGTYSGSYRVLGDLVLTNGNYTLNNATFYVEGVAGKAAIFTGGYQRNVSGSTITVGANATLTLDNSTLTAAGSTTDCPMWRGVVLDDRGQAPAGAPYQLVVQNNSVISHALCAVKAETSTPAYVLDHSTFAHNLTHVYDKAIHTGSQVSQIAHCTFSSDPAQMHLPYDQTSTSDKFYTYQALCLTPNGNYNNVLDVHDNT
ncbi:MAG: hypothetical protein EOO62_35035, partial [Hymenobacter sp.]